MKRKNFYLILFYIVTIIFIIGGVIIYKFCKKNSYKLDQNAINTNINFNTNLISENTISNSTVNEMINKENTNSIINSISLENKVVEEENNSEKVTKNNSNIKENSSNSEKVNSTNKAEDDGNKETNDEKNIPESKPNKDETQISENIITEKQEDNKEEEIKEPEMERCTNNSNHGMDVGNSGMWFNTKEEAIAYYDEKIAYWGKLWENFEIDDETYKKNCPYRI